MVCDLLVYRVLVVPQHLFQLLLPFGHSSIYKGKKESYRMITPFLEDCSTKVLQSLLVRILRQVRKILLSTCQQRILVLRHLVAAQRSGWYHLLR